jgi:hypothetical protein
MAKKVDHTHGDNGTKPADNLNFQIGDKPDPETFDWFWSEVPAAINNHADTLESIDSDGDGTVDEAETLVDFDEKAQDVIAAAFASDNNVDISYDDANDTLTVSLLDSISVNTLDAQDTFTDPNGTSHTGELADLSDIPDQTQNTSQTTGYQTAVVDSGNGPTVTVSGSQNVEISDGVRIDVTIFAKGEGAATTDLTVKLFDDNNKKVKEYNNGTYNNDGSPPSTTLDVQTQLNSQTFTKIEYTASAGNSGGGSGIEGSVDVQLDNHSIGIQPHNHSI